MKPHAKTALSLALAIVGGMVAGEHDLDILQRLCAVLLNGHHVRQNLCGVVQDY